MSLVPHEFILRLALFGAVFLILAVWEVKSQRTSPGEGRKERWRNHFALAFTGAVLVRTFLPLASLSLAVFAAGQGWGLFNHLDLPSLFTIPFCVIALDWMVYYQHRALHAVPLLWKFHRVHHSDRTVDVATGMRFHFLETGFTLGVKALVVCLLGCPLEALLVYELIQSAALLFAHSNVPLGGGGEKALRLLCVTPAMHRIHHSASQRERNKNFGFIFSWWDRLFGTYLGKGAEGEFKAGLEGFGSPEGDAFPNLLMQPFMDGEEGLAWKNLTSSENAYRP